MALTRRNSRCSSRNGFPRYNCLPALTREYILKLNPDVLIGGSFGKLDSTFFKNYPELKRIRAYQTRRVYGITGNLMERPGPRVVESVRELQKLVAGKQL